MHSWAAGTTKHDSRPTTASAEGNLSSLEARFECDLCQKRFTRAANLKNHYRFHTDERPFACEMCDKRFRRQYDCKAHQALHSGIKKHECSGSINGQKWGCHRRFARESSLERHKMSTKACQCLRRRLEKLSDGAMSQWAAESEAHGVVLNTRLSTPVGTFGVLLRPYPPPSAEMPYIPRPAIQKLLSRKSNVRHEEEIPIAATLPTTESQAKADYEAMTTLSLPSPLRLPALEAVQLDWDGDIPLLAQQNPTEDPASFTITRANADDDVIDRSADLSQFPDHHRMSKKIDRLVQEIGVYWEAYIPAEEREAFREELQCHTIQLRELEARLYKLHVRVFSASAERASAGAW